MKNLIVSLVAFSTVVFSLLVSVAQAETNYSFACKHDNSLRSIEVVYLEADATVPCEVRYHKDDETSVLWSANNQLGYCELKAQGFAEKQEAWGWACSKEALAEAPKPEIEPEMLEAALEEGDDKKLEMKPDENKDEQANAQ